MSARSNSIDLQRFTFDSLYFCQTPLSAYRGNQFAAAVNQWYLAAIRSGLAPPLGFVLDLGNLLLRPSVGLDHRPLAGVKPEIRELLRNYARALLHLRDQPVFAETATLVESLPDLESQFRAVGQFLKYLLVEFHNLEATYVFQARNRFTLRGARVNSKGLTQVVGNYRNNPLPATIVREELGASAENEFGPLVALYQWITNFYSQVPLASFFSPEERLMVELAARIPTGINAADFCLVKQVLNQPDIPSPEELEPLPRFVELTIPTESMQVDGPTSGYVDIQTRTFSGNFNDILPTELALALPTSTEREQPTTSVSQYQFYDRLVNGGVPHYVRENIVCIEREFRVLVTFVVDARARLRQSESAHADFEAAGVTPYVRARTLVTSMMRDLALYFPREDVRLEAAIYLYDCEMNVSYRRHVNLLDSVSREVAETPLQFAGRLGQLAPHFFNHRISRHSAENCRDGLDTNPFQFAQQRHTAQNFHSRHFVVLTTQALGGSLVAALGDTGTIAGSRQPHLNLAVYCDVDYHAVGVSLPRRWSDLASNASDGLGRLGEMDVRSRFMDEVLERAAGRSSATREVAMGGLIV